MLDEARPYPEIEITEYKFSDDILFTIPHENIRKRAIQDTCGGCYQPTTNTIQLSAYPDTEIARDIMNEIEDAILHTILHETDHWAQFMYLDIGEMLKSLNEYNGFKKNNSSKIPFIENNNFFKSEYWIIKEKGYYEELERRVKWRTTWKPTSKYYSSFIQAAFFFAAYAVLIVSGNLGMIIPMSISFSFMTYDMYSGWDKKLEPYFDDCSPFEPKL